MKIEENIILNSKIVRKVLIHLNKGKIDYASNTSKIIDSTFCSVLANFKILEKEGLIELVENKGRKKYPFIYKNKKVKHYRLTEKGNKIVELLFKIDEELK